MADAGMPSGEGVRGPYLGPYAWKRSDVESASDWVHVLGAAEVAELEAAVRHAKARARPLRALTPADFPLPGLARRCAGWLRELDHGRGFLLVRGLPVERWGDDDAALAWWGLGLHLGDPVSQNAAGDLLGHVRDFGLERRDPSLRLYKTRERLGFHTDGADVIGLLCLRPAKSGGVSRIASSAAVFNEIRRRRPDLVPVLFEPFAFDRNDEQAPGEAPFFRLPVCFDVEGRLRTFYIGWYIRDAQRHADAPRLTAAQAEVIDLIDAIAAAPEVALDMDFRAGDIQLLKNSAILHARTEFEDFDDPARKRHLLRLWLNPRSDFADGDALLRSGIPVKEGSIPDAAGG